MNPFIAPGYAASLASGLALAELILLLGPPVAVSACSMVSSPFARAFIWIPSAAAASLIAIIGLWKLGFRFTLNFANLGAIGYCYEAYCFLAACCLRIRSTCLRIPLLVILTPPIVCGYVIGTVGIIGLGYMLPRSKANLIR